MSHQSSISGRPNTRMLLRLKLGAMTELLCGATMVSMGKMVVSVSNTQYQSKAGY